MGSTTLKRLRRLQDTRRIRAAATADADVKEVGMEIAALLDDMTGWGKPELTRGARGTPRHRNIAIRPCLPHSYPSAAPHGFWSIACLLRAGTPGATPDVIILVTSDIASSDYVDIVLLAAKPNLLAFQAVLNEPTASHARGAQGPGRTRINPCCGRARAHPAQQPTTLRSLRSLPHKVRPPLQSQLLPVPPSPLP